MNVYVESSAVLAWLFEEPPGGQIGEVLREADMIVASDLTLVECSRALVRAGVMGDLPEHEAAGRRRALESTATEWNVLSLGEEVVQQARRRFPSEPVRTLDALHIASALTARQLIPDLALLSLDKRVRENGSALGFDVLPA